MQSSKKPNSSKFLMALENPRLPYLIGETAYIHEGNFGYMMALVKEVIEKDACDAIKFHIMADLDSYITPSHQLYGLYKRMTMPLKDWIKILEFVKSKKFEVIVLADDKMAIDFVKENLQLVDVIELHAVALNNIEMLEKLKGIKIPIILGIGGSTIDDIEYALGCLGMKDLLLMHGFQNYPTKHEYINFGRMQKAREKFNLTVGYADHTSWESPNNELLTLAGFMAGANIIEKHVTLKQGERRIDFEASISVENLKKIREKMDLLNSAKGDGSFEISEYEDIYAKNGPMKFTIVAKDDMKTGETITKDGITFKRTGEENNIRQRAYNDILGRKAKKDIGKNSLLNWNNVEK